MKRVLFLLLFVLLPASAFAEEMVIVLGESRPIGAADGMVFEVGSQGGREPRDVSFDADLELGFDLFDLIEDVPLHVILFNRWEVIETNGVMKVAFGPRWVIDEFLIVFPRLGFAADYQFEYPNLIFGWEARFSDREGTFRGGLRMEVLAEFYSYRIPGLTGGADGAICHSWFCGGLEFDWDILGRPSWAGKGGFGPKLQVHLGNFSLEFRYLWNMNPDYDEHFLRSTLKVEL